MVPALLELPNPVMRYIPPIADIKTVYAYIGII